MLARRNLKFSANISSLFMDIPDHIESYREILNRKDFKFTAVEAQNPYQNCLDSWRAELESGKVELAEFVLINSPAIFEKYGSRLPSEKQFEADLDLLASYVQLFNVRKVHLLLSDIGDSSEMDHAKRLLAKGAQFLHNLNVTCLIEPLSMRANYYLRSYDVALKLVKELKEPNLKILFDTYHCQRLHGNIVHYIELLRDHIGHVQISQVPLRDSPLNEGELNHDYILGKISTIYDDFIGLEYYNYVDDSFEWVRKYSANQTQVENSN